MCHQLLSFVCQTLNEVIFSALPYTMSIVFPDALLLLVRVNLVQAHYSLQAMFEDR